MTKNDEQEAHEIPDAIKDEHLDQNRSVFCRDLECEV
jgi:hypothetical protein